MQCTAINPLSASRQVVEDPLQAQRLKYAFESEKGLLGTSGFLLVHQSSRALQCTDLCYIYSCVRVRVCARVRVRLCGCVAPTDLSSPLLSSAFLQL